MARGAHPQPRRVFLGRLESNFPPPSCSHQRFVLREFPISPDWDNRRQRTNRGGRTSQSPLPHPNPLDRISSQSRSGGLFLRAQAFEGLIYTKNSVGAPRLSMGVSFSDACFMWETIDSAPPIGSRGFLCTEVAKNGGWESGCKVEKS